MVNPSMSAEKQTGPRYYSSAEINGPRSARRGAPSQEEIPATDSEYSVRIPPFAPKVDTAAATRATELEGRNEATAVPIDDDVASIDESVVGGKAEEEAEGTRGRRRRVTDLQWGMLGCRIAEVVLCIIAFA